MGNLALGNHCVREPFYPRENSLILIEQTRSRCCLKCGVLALLSFQRANRQSKRKADSAPKCSTYVHRSMDSNFLVYIQQLIDHAPEHPQPDRSLCHLSVTDKKKQSAVRFSPLWLLAGNPPPPPCFPQLRGCRGGSSCVLQSSCSLEAIMIHTRGLR